MLLVSEKQYVKMKNLINDLFIGLERVAGPVDRNALQFLREKVKQTITNLEYLHKQISEEFNDGKINKKSYQCQIESLQESLYKLKGNLTEKQKQSTKYSSDLLKFSHENQKIKDYIKRLKDENKSLKAQLSELANRLSQKMKKYKAYYDEQISGYKVKIKYLEGKLNQKSNELGDELDKELEQLAKMEEDIDEEQIQE